MDEQSIQFFNLDGENNEDQPSTGQRPSARNISAQGASSPDVINDLSNQFNQKMGMEDSDNTCDTTWKTALRNRLSYVIPAMKEIKETIQSLSAEITNMNSEEDKQILLAKLTNQLYKYRNLEANETGSIIKQMTFKRKNYEDLIKELNKDSPNKNCMIQIQKKLDAFYPDSSNMFKAFNLTRLNQVRVVIIGQDPSKVPGLYTGVAFSQDNQMHCDDLHNLFSANYLIFKGLKYSNCSTDEDKKEFWRTLENDYERYKQFKNFIDNKKNKKVKNLLYNNFEEFKKHIDSSELKDVAYNTHNESGNLEYLATQGVLLLNVRLTAASEVDGLVNAYKIFMKTILQIVFQKNEKCVFYAFGTPAKNLMNDASLDKNYCFKSGHPSSYMKEDIQNIKEQLESPFFDQLKFNDINILLRRVTGTGINWCL